MSDSRKQVNFNTLVSAGVGVLIAILGYGAKHEFESLVASNSQMGKSLQEITSATVETRANVAGIGSRLTSLESAVKEFVTRSEFNAELSSRDQTISREQEEILQLKKELSDLRKRIAATNGGNN